jgi:hypothetical protein
VPAPIAGLYEQRNVFGGATGHRVNLVQGEMLPAAPRGFSWCLIESHAARTAAGGSTAAESTAADLAQGERHGNLNATATPEETHGPAQVRHRT